MESSLKETQTFRFVDRNVLKYIAIFAMFLDHFAILLIPAEHFLYVSFRFVSRITATIMTFFIAEGYVHTHDVKAYAKRLFIFAVISWLPFLLFESNKWLPFEIVSGNVSGGVAALYLPFADSTVVFYMGSMIFTLFLGLITIWMWDKAKIHAVLKVLITLVICWIADFNDWGYWAILYCLSFWALRDKPLWKWIAFTAISLLYVFNVAFFLNNAFAPHLDVGFRLYRMGFVLAIPLLAFFYNGKGGKKSSFNKWFFYIFYPAHLVLLYVITLIV